MSAPCLCSVSAASYPLRSRQPHSLFVPSHSINILFHLYFFFHSFLLTCCCDCANFPNVGILFFFPLHVRETNMHYFCSDSDLRQAVCGSSLIFCTVSRRQRLFENLRMLPHAPGVQMQAIPEDAVQEDSGDEEEDDPNKRISSKKTSRKVPPPPPPALQAAPYLKQTRLASTLSPRPRQEDSLRGGVLRLGGRRRGRAQERGQLQESQEGQDRRRQRGRRKGEER